MKSYLEKNTVAQCRAGDKSAYAGLVRTYSDRVFAMCLGILGNSHDAENIAHQAMLKGFTDINQLRDGRQFGAWIIRIAKNLCIDLIRRQKRIQNVSAEQIAASQSRSGDYPELQAALAKLPREYSLALMLFYFDGRNTENIAALLDISQGTAQTHLCRARKHLHGLLRCQVE